MTLLYEAGQVNRYHTNPVMARTPQTNADHSWGVVAILIDLLEGNVSRNLLLAAILHDADEILGGDLPYPVKKANPEFAKDHAELTQRMAADHGFPPVPELTEEEAKWLHFADRLECQLRARLYEPALADSAPWFRSLDGEILPMADELGVGLRVRRWFS